MGPVISSVYHEFKPFADNPINVFTHDGPILNPEQKELIEKVDKAYKEFDAYSLSTITHEPGTPWHTVINVQKNPFGHHIPDLIIKEYFKKLARESK